MYCAFMHIFPDSGRDFHDEFKSWLVSVITEWVTGVSPSPGTWRDWKLAKLEPAHATVVMTETQRKGSMIDQTPPTSVASAADEPQRSFQDRKTIHPDAAYQTESVLFNVSGHTPLMAQYLRSHGLIDTTGSAIFVHRTQLSERLASP